MTSHPRRCPVCGYEDNTGRGHILAAANDISPVVIRARCHCPACRATWDEWAFFSGRVHIGGVRGR